MYKVPAFLLPKSHSNLQMGFSGILNSEQRIRMIPAATSCSSILCAVSAVFCPRMPFLGPFERHKLYVV